MDRHPLRVAALLSGVILVCGVALGIPLSRSISDDALAVIPLFLLMGVCVVALAGLWIWAGFATAHRAERRRELQSPETDR